MDVRGHCMGATLARKQHHAQRGDRRNFAKNHFGLGQTVVSEEECRNCEEEANENGLRPASFIVRGADRCDGGGCKGTGEYCKTECH